VREKLHLENKDRFFDKERTGNCKDNLICTLLDPRFKLINCYDSTVQMKRDAETYLKENFKADWSLKARAVEIEEIPAPATTTTTASTPARARTTTPSSVSKSPTNGKKKKVLFTSIYC
jgi:hypothetical protein